jgi:flagellar assembly factor FliW
MTAMNIDNPHAGSIGTASADRVIEFPAGLAGFEELRRFSLFHPETVGDAPPRYFILQSLDDSAIAFHIADPELFGFNYEIKLLDDEIAALELSDPADVAVVVILVKENLSGGTPLRANLKAPLIINLRTRRGIQHVFASLNYQVTLKSPE